MPRVKRGVTAHARHKKVIEKARGFRGRRGNVFRIATEAVMKAGQYAYRDRRAKKRDFRGLWIARINAGARELGITRPVRVVSSVLRSGWDHGMDEDGCGDVCSREVYQDAGVGPEAVSVIELHDASAPG